MKRENSNKKGYVLNLFSAYGSSMVSALIGIATAPISLSYWKIEKFGVWSIITSFAAYLSVSGLGIDVACGILMTKNASIASKNRIFKRSLAMITLTALALLALLVLLSKLMPGWITYLGNMSLEVKGIARKTTLIFVFSFIINIPFGVIANSFASYQKAYLNNIFNLFQAILGFIVLLAVIVIKLNMPMYAILVGISWLILNIIKTIIFLREKNIYEAETKESIGNRMAEESRHIILITGVRLWLYGMALMVTQNIGSLIISNHLSINQVTPYILTYKIFSLLFTIVTMTNISAAPMLGREYSIGNWPWIIQMHKKLFISTLFLNGAIWIGSIMFLKDVIRVWVGATGYAGFLTTVLLGAWFLLHGLSNLNYVVINAFNYTKKISLISWLETIVFIIVSTLLIGSVGIAAIPIGLLCGTIIGPLWALPYIIHKRSKGSLKYDINAFKKALIVIASFVVLAVFSEYYLAETILKLGLNLVIFGFYCIIFYKILWLEIGASIKLGIN